MSDADYKKIINNTVGGVLEQTAFMFPEPADMVEGVSFEEFDFIIVSLDFTGDRSGSVKMIVPVEFCGELSANLLGEEIGDSDPGENNFDAAREMLNIVAGQLLVSIFGDKALFSLANLQAKSLDKEEIFGIIGETDYACSMVDDYPVITIFSLEGKIYEHKSIGG